MRISEIAVAEKYTKSQWNKKDRKMTTVDKIDNTIGRNKPKSMVKRR